MQKREWDREISELIKANVCMSRKSRRGRPRLVQEATVVDRKERIQGLTRDLRILKILPESVAYVKEKHVMALVSLWEARAYSPGALLKKITALRMLLEWTGKRDAIRDPVTFVKNPERLRRRYVPPVERNWSHLGVDPAAAILAVSKLDKHVGMQLNAIHVFQLNRVEALRLKPWRADKGHYLAVSDGTRGRPDRMVGPLTPEQRDLLDELKRFAGDYPERSLSRPGRTLEQATARFKYVLRKAGITRKGLGVTAWGLGREKLLQETKGQILLKQSMEKEHV